MLGLAKRVGARFLLTSTSEVYGDPLQHPQVETYWGNVNPIGEFFSLFSRGNSWITYGTVHQCWLKLLRVSCEFLWRLKGEI